MALFDGGDTIHGTFPAVKSKGDLFLPVLNEMKFDAMTAHWEFAYTPEGFKSFTKKLNYPMLAINCYYKDSNELVFEPYRVMEVNNIRIGSAHTHNRLYKPVIVNKAIVIQSGSHGSFLGLTG
ncbi:MAG: hypothetical protein ACM3P0_05985 [Acidobacteriota bacterium]